MDMHISEVLRKHNPAISFEFFPPKTQEASQELFQTISALMPLKPAYVSVTYGAGGSTRERTHDLVVKLQRETDLTIVSHLTCVGSRRQEIHQILSKYQESGIHNIMALRGDPPKGSTDVQIPADGFQYASELVQCIKQHYPDMGVGVAGFPEGHPGTPNRLLEMDNLKRKVDAGADYICTQLFFDNRDFFDFCERCEVVGIKVPIIAGIMPIISRKGMARMSELALGARIPAKLLRAMDRAENDAYAERVGIHWSTEQVVDLVDHKVKGIHFYTLNKSKATLKIYESLGIQSSESLQHTHE
jgi:methylenetetrahydrofolate reductase (NADPH)